MNSSLNNAKSYSKGEMLEDVVLYKYRSLASDVERERVKDILVNSRLHAASRLAFNDPFDCRIPLSWDAPEERLKELLLQAYEKNGLKLPPNILEVIEVAGGMETLKESAALSAEEEMNKTGIICLSEEARDILMWSHYADKHRGICLQFQALKNSIFGRAITVIYSETYPRLNIAMDSQELADGLFRTKSNHWSYERERRILLSGGGVKDFPKNCLVGVIFGSQIPPEHELFIRTCLLERTSPVTLYRAVKSKDKFALDIQEIETTMPVVL